MRSEPSALGASTEAVYLVTVTVVVSTNFVVFRHGIFHAKPAISERDHEAPALVAGSPSQTSVEQPMRFRGATEWLQNSYGPIVDLADGAVVRYQLVSG